MSPLSHISIESIALPSDRLVFRLFGVGLYIYIIRTRKQGKSNFLEYSTVKFNLVASIAENFVFQAYSSKIAHYWYTYNNAFSSNNLYTIKTWRYNMYTIENIFTIWRWCYLYIFVIKAPVPIILYLCQCE